MSKNQTGVTPGQGEGQPQVPAPVEQSVTPPAGEGAEQNGQTEQAPEFLTLEQAEQWKQDILRQAQSYSDKGRARLQQKLQQVEDTIKNAEKFGRPFTEEAKAQLRQNAQVAAMKEADASDEDTPPAMPAQAQQELQYFAEHDLGAHDLKMQGKYNVQLQPEDPEVKQFKITGDPKQDAANIEAMYKAKADRLASGNNTQTNQDEATSVRPDVRLPSGGGQTPNALANIEDPNTLLNMAAKKMRGGR